MVVVGKKRSHRMVSGVGINMPRSSPNDVR